MRGFGMSIELMIVHVQELIQKINVLDSVDMLSKLNTAIILRASDQIWKKPRCPCRGCETPASLSRVRNPGVPVAGSKPRRPCCWVLYQIV